MRGFILFIALVCIAVTFGVNREWKQMENGESSRWSVGLFFSPMMVFENTTEYRDGKLLRFQRGGRVKFISWSFASLITGVMLLRYWHRLGIDPHPSKAGALARDDLREEIGT
jgi:hypothetical protein